MCSRRGCVIGSIAPWTPLQLCTRSSLLCARDVVVRDGGCADGGMCKVYGVDDVVGVELWSCTDII